MFDILLHLSHLGSSTPDLEARYPMSAVRVPKQGSKLTGVRASSHQRRPEFDPDDLIPEHGCPLDD